MSVTIQLAPEVERRLQEKAAREGQSLAEYLQRLAEESVFSSQSPPAQALPRPLTAEEWIAELRAWAASHAHWPTDVDDSRESIYAGRGE